MKYNEITINQEFITSSLPINAAKKCGIICIDKLQNPNRIILKRMTSDEQWPVFTDKNDECNMGNWIPNTKD